MAEKRNRTFEEIAKEEEEKKRLEAEKKKKRPAKKLNVKVPNIFPRLNLKRWVKYSIVGIVLLVLLAIVNGYHSNQICSELEVNIISKEENAFLTQKEIEKIIEAGYDRPIIGARMGAIELKKVEDALKQSPYMADAQVSKTFRGKLHIDAKLREPMARIINSDGTSMYLDKDGIKFPTLNRHSSNVPLIRGALYETELPKDSFACELIRNALPVIKYVHANPFWKTQISEIYITQGNEIIFYPQVGNIYIEFGEPKHIEEKFENMKLFYEQVIKQVGWNKYKGFSVKFKGQVVGKRV